MAGVERPFPYNFAGTAECFILRASQLFACACSGAGGRAEMHAPTAAPPSLRLGGVTNCAFRNGSETYLVRHDS